MGVDGDGETSEGLALQEMMQSTCRGVVRVKDAAMAVEEEILMAGRKDLRGRGEKEMPRD